MESAKNVVIIMIDFIRLFTDWLVYLTMRITNWVLSLDRLTFFAFTVFVFCILLVINILLSCFEQEHDHD